MDKTAIKNFSIWARNKLIADITYKAGLLGITGEGIKDALPQSTKEAEFYDIGTKEPYQIVGNEIKQRRQLVEIIKKKTQSLKYSESYRNVMEEVAYTWFNRLIAIRFMEVNDYMPAHVRVLSSESGTKLEPDLVTNPFDAELVFTSEEEQYILKMKNDNAVNELFQFLFIRQCNALNGYLPKLFENTADYTELLLNVSVTDQDGIVYHLIHDIEEKDFNIAEGGQVEIIGWMYQYYNTEPKDETFALLKKNVKITKERIPAATQLFTPDWIVRYMVENSLGRLWLEGHPDGKVNSTEGGRESSLGCDLKKEWKYYLDEAEQEADVAAQLKEIRKEYKNIKPEDIKIIDPCMGSGHILVYAFDVLMQIYENYGYSHRDAAKSILNHNIYGLDIDNRAFQLAYFAVMMKARQYNRRILTQGIEPNLCAIQESNGLKADIDMGDFLLSEEHRETLRYLLDVFVDAKEYGSILEVENRDYAGFLEAWEQAAEQTVEDVVMIMWYSELNGVVPTLAKQAMILAQKYDVVVTNPPYMAVSNANSKLNDYIKKHYADEKVDLYAVFISRCIQLAEFNRFQAMITQHGWMFLRSFEKMRTKLLNYDIVNMAHLGARAFEEISGEIVQTVSFVGRKSKTQKYIAKYVRLVSAMSQQEKEEDFLSGNNIYCSSADKYENIAGTPVAYWIKPALLESFSNKSLGDYAYTKQGFATGNNDLFLRLWFEVKRNNSAVGLLSKKEAEQSKYKWFPCNKGGTYRKWYGNNYYVANWEDNGKDMREYKGSVIRNSQFYFMEGITWSSLANQLSVRYSPEGFVFESKGSMCYTKGELSIFYILGLLNSKVVAEALTFLSPTLDFHEGPMAKVPMKIVKNMDEIVSLVKENIRIVKEDWDMNEYSWDFQNHPMVYRNINSVAEAYIVWRQECEKRYSILKENEEKLNRIFLTEYGLNDDVSYEVASEEMAFAIPSDYEAIKTLISYAVGCMFGRYSLAERGIQCDEIELNKEKYSQYVPDNDNVIPITDEEYFEDDIVTRFCEWIKIVYGEKLLEENLRFISDTLGMKGSTPKEKIRNYFLNTFYKDHCVLFSASGAGKRPIYWLFDSGKQNGFKALIYMHRYNADTIGNLRVDYLHRMQRIYENEISRMQDMIDNSDVAREVTAATKRKEKLQKQLKECQEYDERIGHLALSRIEIDLDDGVKVNYEKIQTARDGKKYQVLAKI